MKHKSELRQIADNPSLPTLSLESLVPPSEISRWRRLVTRFRKRRNFILDPDIEVQEIAVTEIARIEARVRKELYPSKPKFYILPTAKNSNYFERGE